MVRDRKIVAEQIGRTPRGDFAVAVRCSYGCPQVIRVHPLVWGKPFPTLYWLTCPYLAKEVDRLEASGWVKRLESRMASEQELRSAMQAAHRSYIRQRDRLLSPEEVRVLEAGRVMAGLQGRGIGGISDWNRLKCLHLHVAHKLADDNPVGGIVLSMLPVRECSSEEMICSAFG